MLARIGAEIGTCDRGGAIGPPDRSENDDRGGLICIGRLHFDLQNQNGQVGTSFGNLLAWLAQGSQILYFLGIFFRFGNFNLVCYEEIFEGDGANRAGVIGLIRQGFASVGLEADQPDCDRVSSDQGFLIGRSGCDRSDQGQLRSRIMELSSPT